MTRENVDWKQVQKCALFQNVEPDRIADSLTGEGCTRKTYRKGEVIYEPHAFFRSLGILLSGRVAVNKGDFPVNHPNNVRRYIIATTPKM